MNPLPPSVVELDGPFEHEFLHTRGIRLHAATAGNPDDPLVLLLHGSFGGWFKQVKAPEKTIESTKELKKLVPGKAEKSIERGLYT
ncbi:hypothetical protein CBG03_08805 [Streptococcus pyogenes]|nr:hypothetical protein CBG03_08805 [Streptococcus pyogenes]